jgi:hypothetical protein
MSHWIRRYDLLYNNILLHSNVMKVLEEKNADNTATRRPGQPSLYSSDEATDWLIEE